MLSDEFCIAELEAPVAVCTVAVCRTGAFTTVWWKLFGLVFL